MQVLIGGFFATMILTCLHAHGIFSEVDLSSATGISAEQASTIYTHVHAITRAALSRSRRAPRSLCMHTHTHTHTDEQR